MKFDLPPELKELKRRTQAFVADEILPVEADRLIWDAHENIRLDRLASYGPRPAPLASGRRRRRKHWAGWVCRGSAWRSCTSRPTGRSSDR